MINISVHIPGFDKRRRGIGMLHFAAGFFMFAIIRNVYVLIGRGSNLPLLPLIVVAVVSFAYGALRKKLDPAAKYNFGLRLIQFLIFLGYTLAFILSGNVDGSMGLMLWIVISGHLVVSERIALQEEAVQFAEKGIIFPANYRHKEIFWNAVAHVTLRPDFLTIHYRNNRYLQFELRQCPSDADIEQLQDFCHRQISNAAVASQV